MNTRQSQNKTSGKNIVSRGRLNWIAVLLLVTTIPIASLVAWTTFTGLNDSPEEPRLIIVARDMNFYVENSVTGKRSSEANPTLRLPAGQSMSIYFRNEDQGMQHNLVIPSLGLKTRLLSAGEQQRIHIEKPMAFGEAGNIGDSNAPANYFCSLHPQLMRGKLVIE